MGIFLIALHGIDLNQVPYEENGPGCCYQLAVNKLPFDTVTLFSVGHPYGEA